MTIFFVVFREPLARMESPVSRDLRDSRVFQVCRV